MDYQPSPEEVEDILHEYRKTPSPFRVAKKVGLPVQVIWAVIDNNGDRLVAHTEQHGGEGRPELLPYRVGKIRASQNWNNQDPAIAQARADYEAGTVELVTGRDGAWLLLYAIPRKKVQPRPDYFKLEV